MVVFLTEFTSPYTTWSSAMGGCGPLKWGPSHQHHVPGMLMFIVLNTHVLGVLAGTGI